MRVPIPEPPDNPPCFACGSKNPEGLHLQFFREGESVVTELVPKATMSGWGRVLHGGFQSLLLDEVCSWAVATLMERRTFVTTELQVTFKKPVIVERPLTVRGFLVAVEGADVTTRGEIVDADGTVLSEGRATIRILGRERFESLVEGE